MRRAGQLAGRSARWQARRGAQVAGQPSTLSSRVRAAKVASSRPGLAPARPAPRRSEPEPRGWSGPRQNPPARCAAAPAPRRPRQEPVSPALAAGRQTGSAQNRRSDAARDRQDQSEVPPGRADGPRSPPPRPLSPGQSPAVGSAGIRWVNGCNVPLLFGLSPGAAHERVRKLRERGVIRRTTIEVDPAAVGRSVRYGCPMVAAWVISRESGGTRSTPSGSFR